MTRKKAIKRLKEIDIRDALQEDYDALYMAVEALEQEPVLDKIRAGITEKAKRTMNDTRAEGLYMALQIIDKYRGEQCQR